MTFSPFYPYTYIICKGIYTMISYIFIYKGPHVRAQAHPNALLLRSLRLATFDTTGYSPFSTNFFVTTRTSSSITSIIALSHLFPYLSEFKFAF